MTIPNHTRASRNELTGAGGEGASAVDRQGTGEWSVAANSSPLTSRLHDLFGSVKAEARAIHFLRLAGLRNCGSLYK